jgi:hypothetical protein
MIIETDHERRDEIEFASEMGKGSKGLNARNNAADSEQACDFTKHREVIHVETKSRMPEQLRDVQKIPCAAAKIENALRARHVELDLANSANVDIDPVFEIEIFRPVFTWIFDSVALANLLETCTIDRIGYAPGFETKTVWPKKPERVPSGAGQALAIDKFLKLMGKFLKFMANSHWRIDHSLWRSATISTKLQMK